MNLRPRILAPLLLVTALLAGCAAPNGGPRGISRMEGTSQVSKPTVFPMSLDDVRRMLRDGKTATDVISELDRTSTVLNIKPSEVPSLLAEGIPADVLDWLHQRQIDALEDTWKTRLARQEEDQKRELQRIRNEMELRCFSRYPYYPYNYPYYRYGPGLHFGF